MMPCLSFSSVYTCVALSACATLASTSRSSGTSTALYDAFRERYGRNQRGDAGVSYRERLVLFEERKAEVEAHNAQPDKTWVATINEFADYTPLERRALLGYERVGGRWSSQVQPETPSSFLQAQPQVNAENLAESVDWTDRLGRSKDFLRNQEACGSCWAVAAVGVLEMRAELEGGPTRMLSFEQLVGCVPNPRECGGKGGCQGATAELAFKYVKEHGVVDAGNYKGYESGGGAGCYNVPEGVPRTTIGQYLTLPVNSLHHLMKALLEGPVVVSVDASRWAGYDTGVFNGCMKNATVNHAVAAVGFGQDKRFGKFWRIRNSWGPGWGEPRAPELTGEPRGYIRLKRHDRDEDGNYCGTDHAPQEGVYCKNGPKEVEVCGMCGILSDSSFPRQVKIPPLPL